MKNSPVQMTLASGSFVIAQKYGTPSAPISLFKVKHEQSFLTEVLSFLFLFFHFLFELPRQFLYLSLRLRWSLKNNLYIENILINNEYKHIKCFQDYYFICYLINITKIDIVKI